MTLQTNHWSELRSLFVLALHLVREMVAEQLRRLAGRGEVRT